MNRKPAASSQQPAASSQQPAASKPITENLLSPVIERAVAYIEKNIAHDNLSDDRIAREAGTTTATLIAQFEAFFSISPWEYVMEHRLVFAKALLENTSKPIYEIALDVGMDPKYFSDFFKARMGISATEYRKSLDAE